MDDPDCRVDIARKVYMGKDGRGSENAVPDCKIEMFVVAEVFQCVFDCIPGEVCNLFFMRRFMGFVVVRECRERIGMMVECEDMRRDSESLPFERPGKKGMVVILDKINGFSVYVFLQNLRHLKHSRS